MRRMSASARYQAEEQAGKRDQQRGAADQRRAATSEQAEHAVAVVDRHRRGRGREPGQPAEPLRIGIASAGRPPSECVERPPEYVEERWMVALPARGRIRQAAVSPQQAHAFVIEVPHVSKRCWRKRDEQCSQADGDQENREQQRALVNQEPRDHVATPAFRCRAGAGKHGELNQVVAPTCEGAEPWSRTGASAKTGCSGSTAIQQNAPTRNSTPIRYSGRFQLPNHWTE